MASKAIGFLNFKFGADLGGFERAMNKAQKKLKKFGTSVGKIGKNMTMGLTLPLVGMGIASLKAFDEQSKAIAQVEAGLKSTGNQIGITSEELQKMAADLQKTSLFGDEEILSDVTAQLLTFTGIAKSQFGETQLAVVNLSTKLKTDLKSTAIMVGKALNDPITQLSALSRNGVRFTDEQKALINSLWEMGDAAGAQAIILKELEIQFGGSAEAARKAGMGPLQALQMQLSDLSEQIGERLLPYVQQFVKWIVGLAEKFDGLSESTKDNIVKWGLILAAMGPVLIIIGKMSIGLSALIGGFKGLRKWMLANPILAWAAAISVAVVAFTDLGRKLFGVSDAQRAVNDINKEAARAISEQKTEVGLLTKILEDENTSLAEKETALKKLQEISPKYYGSLSIAQGKVEGLDTATKNFTASILQQAKAEAARGKLIELNAGLLELELMGLNKKGDAYILLSKKFQDQIDAITNMVLENKKLEDSNEEVTETIDEESEEVKALNAQIAALEEQLKNLRKENKGVIKETKMYSDALEVLSTEFLFMKSSVGDQFKDMLFWTKELTKEQKLANAGWMMFKDVLTSSLDESLDSQEKFFTVFVKNIKKAIRSLLVQLAVMTLIKALMPGSLGGLGKAAFSIANITKSLGSIMNVEGFATGGLVTGPTTALIGEGIGTTASNPEVVAPLNKLKSMIGGQEQNITVTGKLVGNDIFLSNAKTGFNRLRTV
jgi:hypothetical protein